VGLGVGAIAPKAAPPGLLGIKANLLAAFAVLTGCAVAAAMARFFGFGIDFGAGMFGGSMTSAPRLQCLKASTCSW
jgi:uncharacterized transporter YbjL